MADGFRQGAVGLEEGERVSLFEAFMTPCVEMKKTRTDDPLGGFDIAWTEGVTFRAAVVKNSTLQARIAEKEGVTEVYTVTTEKGVGLDFHEVFKRLSDGAIFRVTSSAQDSKTPEVASFSFEQVSAERWSLT